LSDAKKLSFAHRYAAVWVSLDFKRHDLVSTNIYRRSIKTRIDGV